MADYDDPRPSSEPTGSTSGAVARDDLITLDRIMTAPTGTEITNRKGKALTPMVDIVGAAQGVVQAAVDAVSADTIQNTEDIAQLSLDSATSAISVVSPVAGVGTLYLTRSGRVVVAEWQADGDFSAIADGTMLFSVPSGYGFSFSGPQYVPTRISPTSSNTSSSLLMVANQFIASFGGDTITLRRSILTSWITPDSQP